MNVRKIVFLVMLTMAATAWLKYADQPTKGNLRRAIRGTLPLL